MRMIAVRFALVLTAACSSGTKSQTPASNTGGGDTSATASEISCTSDGDCVVVQTQCCDHCNGGKAEAYNKAHADAHRARSCEQTVCTDKGCGDATAVCEAGACTVVILPL